MGIGETSQRDTRLEYGVKPSDERSARVPDDYSERRLAELREEARQVGRVRENGVPVAGAPFAKATPQAGYYGIPMTKAPQWTWEVPLYLFAGGAGGAAAVIGEAARMTGHAQNSKLVKDAHTVAAVSALVSPMLLVLDLGRPERFINMLRVFKPQSAMSVGVYILSAFSPMAFLTKAHDFLLDYTHIWPVRFLNEFTQSFSALFGFGMATYTGVLVGATAIPIWNDHVRSLPIHFGMSGTSAATGLLELMGNENRALNLIGIGTALMETAEGLNIERITGDDIARPLKEGLSGALQRLGGLLSGPVPLALRTAALFTNKEQSLKLRKIAAGCCVAGSLVTRYAWIRAGHVSAKDYRLPLQLAPSQRHLPDRSQPPYARKDKEPATAVA
jgi:formate-dependent nitrite reductase membrane component NrfD